MNELNNYIYDIAKKSLRDVNSKGYFDPGHNGPYQDEETPVRNTAHRLYLFSKLGHLYQDNFFLNVANKACDYLCSELARPKNKIFILRKILKKIYLMV